MWKTEKEYDPTIWLILNLCSISVKRDLGLSKFREAQFSSI